MPNVLNCKKEVLSQQILDHLEKHPEAGDTLEGIATWWLEQQRIEQIVDEVSAALEFLVKKGVVQTYRSRSGIIFYKKN